MAEDKTKYIQFPVCMLPEIFTDKNQFFGKALSVGASLYAKRIVVEPLHVAGQLVYHYITDSRSTVLNLLAKFIEAHQGEMIDGELFEIYPERDDRQTYYLPNGKLDLGKLDVLLVKLLEKYGMLNEALSWYQYIEACGYFRIEIKSINTIFSQIDLIPMEGQPLCMVKLDIVLDYLNQGKSDDHLAQFAAYSAIKSILGKKDVILTNKQHIVARMFGASSSKTLPTKKHPLYEKYMNRYHIDKLLSRLELNWGLKTMNIPGLHGIYISFTKEYDQLAQFAENRRMKTKLDALKYCKAEARKSAKYSTLNKVPQLK